MRTDIRDALRALRRSPVFTLVAVLTLALAIGSATAMFGVVDAVFIRGLPYGSADRLQTIYERSESGNLRVPSYPTFRDWQDQAATMKGVVDGFAFVRGDGVMIPGPDGPERKIVAYVTPGFFEMMATPPFVGRTFAPDDESAGSPRVVVISYDYFMRQFGGDRSALGATVSVDSVPTKIIGVMPRGFAYPNFGGTGGWLPPAMWEPIAVFQSTHTALTRRGLHVDSRAIVRLSSRADSARVSAAMKAVQRHLSENYPEEQAHWTSIRLQSLSDELFGPLSTTLLMISAAIALMLVLACANTANLLLIRASSASRDLTVRAALGADRWRLARRQFAEVALLTSLSGACGAVLAFWFVAAVRPYAAQRLAFAGDIHIDHRAAAFVVLLVGLVSLVVSALPVLQVGRSNLIARLRGGSGTQAHGLAERRTRDALAAVQLVLAIAVLSVAGLLVQSLRRLSSVDLGYDQAAISFAISPPAHRYESPSEAAALYRRILDAVDAVPSIEGSAAAGGALLQTKVETEGQSAGAAPPEALYHPVSESYFSLLRIHVVAGRGFGADDMRAPNGFVITENLARKLWPSGNALGQRITVHRASQARADFGQPITLPVVGIVADHRIFGPENDPPLQVFLPYTLEVWPWMNFDVRAPKTAPVVAQIERAVRGVEPAVNFLSKPSLGASGLTGLLTDPRVFVMSLMSAFGAIAMFLAVVGLYGIIAYGVSQRTREFGVRIAVGATPRDIVGMVMRQAGALVIVGIAGGLVVGFLGARLVRSMLFGTSALDPATLVLVPAILAAAAVAASFAPARRAARVDPIVAIRED
ncbi:MAG TPA: ADOP family duplicated permease [Gemmatimonadaceae bacterium]|nr:ADOP family duplicated permease [Gemmatimonadaceae bacterium]